MALPWEGIRAARAARSFSAAISEAASNWRSSVQPSEPLGARLQEGAAVLQNLQPVSVPHHGHGGGLGGNIASQVERGRSHEGFAQRRCGLGSAAAGEEQHGQSGGHANLRYGTLLHTCLLS